MNTKDLLFYKD